MVAKVLGPDADPWRVEALTLHVRGPMELMRQHGDPAWVVENYLQTLPPIARMAPSAHPDDRAGVERFRQHWMDVNQRSLTAIREEGIAQADIEAVAREYDAFVNDMADIVLKVLSERESIQVNRRGIDIAIKKSGAINDVPPEAKEAWIVEYISQGLADHLSALSEERYRVSSVVCAGLTVPKWRLHADKAVDARRLLAAELHRELGQVGMSFRPRVGFIFSKCVDLRLTGQPWQPMRDPTDSIIASESPLVLSGESVAKNLKMKLPVRNGEE